jgi:hypothetical protein
MLLALAHERTGSTMGQYSSSTSGMGATSGGPIAAAAGFALILNVVGLFTFTGVALCVFGYIALTAWLMWRAESGSTGRGSAAGGTGVMIVSWLTALLGGAAVGAFHWVEYAHAAYAVLGFYGLAVAVWLCAGAFGALWRLLFSGIGLAMLAAVVMLAPPPGADDMEKKENWTPVDVMAVDSEGNPIENATVYLDLVQFWSSDPDLDGDRPWWSKDKTGSDGIAHMKLQKDPRFKRLVIRVRHEPGSGGYNEPTTIGACTGHEDARLAATLPAPKVPYDFKVVMPQRPHPDSAFLAIELHSPGTAAASKNLTSHNVKLALTTDSELPWYDGHKTFNDYAILRSGGLRDIFMKDSQRLVFKLGSELAGHSLTLHVLERDYTTYDEAYREIRTVCIDRIALGGQCTLPPLYLPNEKALACRNP